MKKAFSLLETLVAITILGAGLTMVATVFPAALTQHKNSYDLHRSLELADKASVFVVEKVSYPSLYIPDTILPGVDSPWYLLPYLNMTINGPAWDMMPQSDVSVTNLYANLLNGFRSVNVPPYGDIPSGNMFTSLDVNLFPVSRFSPRQILTCPIDQIDDHLIAPNNDEELQSKAYRFVWCGFYRRLANGTPRYAFVICKQRHEQVYAEQNLSYVDTTLPLSYQTPFNAPKSLGVPNRRLPVPWRITVGYFGRQQITNRPIDPLLGNGEFLSDLIPVGSKIMTQGTTYNNNVLEKQIQAGKILTVVRIIDQYTVEVLEDISSFPILYQNGTGTTFDIFIVPPAFSQGKNKTSVMLWRVNS